MDFSFILKPMSYVFVLLLGAVLRNTGFLRDNDHKVVSSIVLTLTLPAAVIRVFSQIEQRSLSLYLIVVLGFLFAALPVAISYVITLRSNKERRVFATINMSGYNVGCFALPIIQNFFGAPGAIVSCMFDIGNGIVATGGAFSVISTVFKTNPEEPAGIKAVIRKLMHSVTFVTYISLLVLNIIGIKIPAAVADIIDPIASANGFLAMFMVGSMFKLDSKKGYFSAAFRHVAIRFVICAVFALFCTFCTPFDALTRRTLAMLSFAPISAVASTYAEKAHCDGGLASFTNMLSVILSLITMIILASLPM